MTRKDGSLALLVVVVWGLNFVVIAGIAQYAAADAGGPALYAGRLPALLFVARPAIPLRLLLGYGLTISFGQFAFFVLRYRPGHAGRGWRRWCCRRKPFYHHSWRLRLWRTLTGQAVADRAGDLRRWCWWREPRRGACPTGGLYADPGGGAQLGLRQYFQQKIMSCDPPANHIAGGVERIDPGAAVYVCLVADRWPAAMLASLRQIDMLTVLSLLYLAFIATLVGYGGIWGSLLGRYETWRVAPLSLLVPVVGWPALLLGETLSGLQLAGAALIMAGLYINVFGLRLRGLAWRAVKKKAPETGLYTSMRVMASQVVLLVVRHAKFVRFIIAGRHMIEIKRRVVMFRRENHCVTLVLPHRRGGLLRIAEAGCQRQKDDSCGSE